MATGFHGIYPILYAFFDAQGRLDRGAMRAQVEACVRHGAHGLAVLGLATETYKLQTPERRQVLRQPLLCIRFHPATLTTGS